MPIALNTKNAFMIRISFLDFIIISNLLLYTPKIIWTA